MVKEILTFLGLDYRDALYFVVLRISIPKMGSIEYGLNIEYSIHCPLPYSLTYSKY